MSVVACASQAAAIATLMAVAESPLAAQEVGEATVPVPGPMKKCQSSWKRNCWQPDFAGMAGWKKNDTFNRLTHPSVASVMKPPLTETAKIFPIPQTLPADVYSAALKENNKTNHSGDIF